MPKRPIREIEALWRALGANDPGQRSEALASLGMKVTVRDDRHQILKDSSGNLVVVKVAPGMPPTKLRNLQLDAIEGDGLPDRGEAPAEREELSPLEAVDDSQEEG